MSAQPGGEGDGPLLVGVLDALRELAASVATRGPDYVDPGAARLATPIWAALAQPGNDARPRYTGQAPCLVGEALARLGVAPAVLAAADQQVARASRIALVDLGPTALSEGARVVLAAAQAAQDSAKTWGRALRAACDTAEQAHLLTPAQRVEVELAAVLSGDTDEQ